MPGDTCAVRLAFRSVRACTVVIELQYLGRAQGIDIGGRTSGEESAGCLDQPHSKRLSKQRSRCAFMEFPVRRHTRG